MPAALRRRQGGGRRGARAQVQGGVGQDAPRHNLRGVALPLGGLVRGRRHHWRCRSGTLAAEDATRYHRSDALLRPSSRGTGSGWARLGTACDATLYGGVAGRGCCLPEPPRGVLTN